MSSRHLLKLVLVVFAVACLLWGGSDLVFGQGPTPPPPKKMSRITNADREAAAARAAAARKAKGLKPAGPTAPFGVRPDCTPGAPSPAAPKFSPGGTPDYFGIYPNWANSQLPELDCSGNIIAGTGIRKFIDALPGLGAASANELGMYVTVAIPDTTTYQGSDYYEIELREYSQRLHRDLPPTKFRGYVQVNTTDPTVNKPSYLGPVIVAQRDKPVRIKFTNKLPTGSGGDLFIPVDSTVMGAGEGPQGTVANITITNGGSGYTAPLVAFSGGGGAGATAVATVVGGAITAVTVTNGGMGYTSAPAVTISGSGTNATATATLIGDAVLGVTVTNGGAGYTGPAATFTGGGIALATATATVGGGAVTGVTVTTGGAGYTSVPTVTFTGGGGTGAAATATVAGGVVTGITVTNGGTGYATPPTVRITGGGVELASGTPIVEGGTITGILITKGGTGYTSPPTVTITGGGGANATATATIVGNLGEKYKQNRAAVHLHGGLTPWISDGTPHQWITPAGESTSYPKGVSVQNVPDMPDPGPGSMTLFYSNQQSARLMFYHDHAYGLTRLNIYAGEAAGYLLQDPVEQQLTASGILPADQIPLVIQDKTFAPKPAQLAAQDPTWNSVKYGGQGRLWFPHVYMPNQNPFDLAGANAMGRWDYGPWFWPPYTGLAHGPVANPYYTPGGTQPPQIPGTPNPSIVPEAFMDTAMVNGTPYPYLVVHPKAYRFRILNASNDRFWNLSLYEAKSNKCMWNSQTGTLLDADAGEVAMVPALPNPAIPFPEDWTTATDGPGIKLDILDGRLMGLPDPRKLGPRWIQIGTEGGFLPAPGVLDPKPIGFQYNLRNIVVLNVTKHSLYLGPAERADVIVDFSQYAGKTLILYNDAPAPVPAGDPRVDYYTGSLDQTATGGTPPTLPGYGPNTRTVMQIRVLPYKSIFPWIEQTLTGLAVESGAPSNAALGGAAAAAPGYGSCQDATPARASGVPYNVDALKAAFASTSTKQGVFAATQDPIIVPQAAYNSAYNANYPADAFVRIQDTRMTFTPAGSSTPITMQLGPKAIQELFEPEYGRMNAILGVEVPNTSATIQTTIPYYYIDPPTENIKDSITPMSPVAGDGTQIWKITHNGVDTHAIHFHLFNVQVINRVGWDGAIRGPEPNELGWKETVLMNPLEDAIVALRPIAPKLPFGVPDSIRPYNVTQPVGSTMGFTNVNTNNNPITVINRLINFGWEYVWHCHLLGHEENDMMRPMVFNFAEVVPTAPVLSGNTTGSTPAAPRVNLTWTDATPPIQANWGNPANEIGFRIERNSGAGFVRIATARANQTAFTDTTAVSGVTHSYRVTVFNAAGNSTSNTVSGITP